MPCPYTGCKMFFASPIFLFRTKIFFSYSASHKYFVPDKKMICIQKNWFLCRHKSFRRGTKCSQIFELTQKIWPGTKHFATCKRTRQQSIKFSGRCIPFIFNNVFVVRMVFFHGRWRCVKTSAPNFHLFVPMFSCSFSFV